MQFYRPFNIQNWTHKIHIIKLINIDPIWYWDLAALPIFENDWPVSCLIFSWTHISTLTVKTVKTNHGRTVLPFVAKLHYFHPLFAHKLLSSKIWTIPFLQQNAQTKKTKNNKMAFSHHVCLFGFKRDNPSSILPTVRYLARHVGMLRIWSIFRISGKQKHHFPFHY